MMTFAGDGASWKQDNERHISGKARRGSAPIVCDVVINKLNLTCAFLPPLCSFELMIRFPFNSGRTSTDPCPGPERPPPGRAHFRTENACCAALDIYGKFRLRVRFAGFDSYAFTVCLSESFVLTRIPTMINSG